MTSLGVPGLSHPRSALQVPSIISRVPSVRSSFKTKSHNQLNRSTPRRFLFDLDALHSGASFNDLFKPDQDKQYEDFNDIVDQDENRVEVFISQELVGILIESVAFKVFIFALIIINSILIGLQTNERLAEDYRLLFNVFDQTVLAVFSCEILLKWYYGFWIFWRDGWNILDFGILAALLIGPQLAFLSSSRVLRILRVLRAFRSLRSVSALTGLRMVVQATLQSIPDMANICLLLLILLLVFGVMGVTLFGSYIPQSFGNLQTAMYSMFICVTEDGWVDLLRQFQSKGTSLHVGGSLYLFVAVLVGAFIFANLVIAVVVTNLEVAMREVKNEDNAQSQHTGIVSGNNSTGEKKKIEIVNLRKFQKNVDLTKQTPMEKSDLRHLNVTKFENYLTVLSALEDNLAEYLDIKQDLTRIYEVVHDLNVLDEADEEADEVGEMKVHTMSSRPSSAIGSTRKLRTGDILSNMIQLEEQGMLTVDDNAHSVADVIRTAKSLSTVKRYKTDS